MMQTTTLNVAEVRSHFDLHLDEVDVAVDALSWIVSAA